MAKKKTAEKELTIYERAQAKGHSVAVIVGLDDRGVVDVITNADAFPSITHILTRAISTVVALEERAIAQGIKEAEEAAETTIEG